MIRRGFKIVVLLIATCVVECLRVTHTITPDTTEQNKWAWSVYAGLGCIGLLYNGLVISMLMLMKNKKSFSFYSLNVCFNINDIIYSIGRIVFGGLQINGYRFEDYSLGCFMDSLLTMIPAAMSVLLLVGISWVVRYDICEGKRFSEADMWKYCGASLLYVTGLCIMLCFVFGYRLDASGTWCLVPQYDASLWIFAACFISIPRLFLIYNLRVTNKIITKAQRDLEALGIQEKAKGHYIKMVKKLNIFVLVTMAQFFPLLGVMFYEIITYQYVPTEYSVYLLTNQTITTCIYNPTLFFYLNFELRQTLFKYVALVLRSLGILSVVKTRIMPRSRLQQNFFSSLVGIRSSQIIPESVTSTGTMELHDNDIENARPIEDIKTYYNIDIWMKDPQLLAAFKEQGRKDYAMENFLFYDDARVYKSMGMKIFKRFESALVAKDDNEPLPADLEKDIEQLERDWEELEKYFVRMYKLYVEIPSSPLEINIPFERKKEITDVYKFLSSSEAVDQQTAPSKKPSLKAAKATVSKNKDVNENTCARIFPLLSQLIESKNNSDLVNTIEKYVEVYKDSYAIIKKVIASDIWPRFLKSELFFKAIEEHRKQHNIH